MSLTDDDLALRRTYLGGTDLAALAGVSRWATPLTVFAEKRPDIWPPGERKVTTTMMAMGNLLEPVVAELFSVATGLRITRARMTVQRATAPDGTKVSARSAAKRCPDHRWEGGNVDRYTSDYGVLECKFAERRNEWGPREAYMDGGDPDAAPAVGPPLVPIGYYTQLQHYLHVAGRRHGWMAVLLGYGDFRWYRIEADPALGPVMVDLASAFWFDHVVPGVPPPPDGSAAAARVIRDRWRSDSGEVLAATPEQAGVLRQLGAAHTAKAQATTTYDTLAQQVQAAMGTAAGLSSPLVSVSWRQNKPSVGTDGAAMLAHLTADLAAHLPVRDTRELTARILADREAKAKGKPHDVTVSIEDLAQQIAADYAAQHVTTKDGNRPFVVTISEPEE